MWICCSFFVASIARSRSVFAFALVRLPHSFITFNFFLRLLILLHIFFLFFHFVRAVLVLFHTLRCKTMMFDWKCTSETSVFRATQKCDFFIMHFLTKRKSKCSFLFNFMRSRHSTLWISFIVSIRSYFRSSKRLSERHQRRHSRRHRRWRWNE